MSFNSRLKTYGRNWLESARVQWPYYLCVFALMVLCWKLWGMAPKNLSKVLDTIQKAHAMGDDAKAEDYVQAWLHRVARVHFFVCGALLLAGPWLVGRGERGDTAPATSSTPGANRWLLIVTGITIVVSALLNYPRLSHSFWVDEEWTARRHVVGEFQDGTLRPPNWHKTLFYYHDPNNHPMFSALARISSSLVPAPTAKEDFHFKEWPIRLPAFLFGLGGLAALAWLASVMGMPRAGMIAVVWMALHPWYVRYGGDARGYALLLTLLPLGMIFLWRGILTGIMNWWLAYGLCEFLILWAYPGALYFVALLNVAAFCLLVTTASPVPRGLQWRRFITANIIGALLTSLMLAPCVQPMLIFLKSGRMKGSLDAAWIKETLSGIFTGIPWAKWETHDLALAWMRTWETAPWLLIVTVVLLTVALLAGMVAVWRRGSMHRWLLGCTLLNGPLMFIIAKMQGNILYSWYMILCLPMLALVVGAGVEQVFTWIPGRRRAVILPVVFLFVFGAATWSQAKLLRHHSIGQMRESVAATRPEPHALKADPGKVITVSLIFAPRIYDPLAVQVKTIADLQKQMDKADAQSVPLWVNFAGKDFLKTSDPAMLAFLDDTTKFQALPPFLGIHGQRERQVYRYLGKKAP